MNLNLYVWEDVLTDHTPGVMFAMASSVKEAQEEILKKCIYGGDGFPGEELLGKPRMVDTPEGFAVWGGG